MILLGDSEATRYRALAARANYLAADRPDMMYATKEMPIYGETNPGVLAQAYALG